MQNTGQIRNIGNGQIIQIKEKKRLFLKKIFYQLRNKTNYFFLNEGNFSKEIKIKFFHGHTKAQIIPFINFKNKTIVFCADLLPSTGHIPLPYVMSYDVQPLITLKEKRFLEEASKKNYILFLEHDYYNECCTIEKKNNKFIVNKKGEIKDFVDL